MYKMKLEFLKLRGTGPAKLCKELAKFSLSKRNSQPSRHFSVSIKYKTVVPMTQITVSANNIH